MLRETPQVVQAHSALCYGLRQQVQGRGGVPLAVGLAPLRADPQANDEARAVHRARLRFGKL